MGAWTTWTSVQAPHASAVNIKHQCRISFRLEQSAQNGQDLLLKVLIKILEVSLVDVPIDTYDDNIAVFDKNISKSAIVE